MIETSVIIIFLFFSFLFFFFFFFLKKNPSPISPYFIPLPHSLEKNEKKVLEGTPILKNCSFSFCQHIFHPFDENNLIVKSKPIFKCHNIQIYQCHTIIIRNKWLDPPKISKCFASQQGCFVWPNTPKMLVSICREISCLCACKK